MKVCTDACLFGAWVGEKVTSMKYGVRTVLDIGTGTGLLSLMLAQKTNARIDAIELDEEAAEQAAENFESSPWQERCQVIAGDARLLHLGRKYNLIISNPPFHENDLKAKDPKLNMALHSHALDLKELMGVIKKNLSPDGKFAILLPWHRKSEFEKLAITAGYFAEELMAVKQTPSHPFFRAMFLFGQNNIPDIQSQLVIRENDRYSKEFISLLKDYYLNL